MWKLAVIALNNYLKNKYPNLKGTILPKSNIIPTSFNVLKEFKIELYYHIPGKNILIFTYSKVENTSTITDGDRLSGFLEKVFLELNRIEDEITKI